MKWFKHTANASRGTSMSLIFAKYKHEGMLAYFLLIELCSTKYDAEYAKINGEFFQFHEQILKEYLRTSKQKVSKFLQLFSELQLISFEKNGEIYQIGMPKLRSIRDNHTKNLQVTGKKKASELPADKEKEKDKEKENNNSGEINVVVKKTKRKKETTAYHVIDELNFNNENINKILSCVDTATQRNWLEMYPDIDYIKLMLFRTINWAQAKNILHTKTRWQPTIEKFLGDNWDKHITAKASNHKQQGKVINFSLDPKDYGFE